MIDTKQLRKQILQRKQIIIHGDLDGLLSYALLKKINPDISLVGIYDLKDLLLFQKSIDTHNALFLDLDMTYDNFFSIGHHMQLFHNFFAYNINPNSLWNIQNFSQKYPFNTFIFLLFLFDIPLSSFNFDILCLIYNTDSVAYNCQKYVKNTQFWDNLLQIGVYKEFQRGGEKIIEGIEGIKKGLGVERQGFPQFKINLKRKAEHQKLYQYLEKKFDIDLSILMDRNTSVFYFNKTYRLEYKVSYNSTLQQLKQELQKEEKKILSHSWTYSSTVNVTYLCI